ncbi:hypothetical protein GEMRC1_007622 [Eukaryota sp. GEM-RC1]
MSSADKSTEVQPQTLGFKIPEDSPFQIINPCFDWAFKRIMHDPSLAREFINMVLRNADDGDLPFRNVALLPVEFDSSSPRTFDFTADLVAAEDEGQGTTKRIICFEMQRKFDTTYYEKLITEVAETRSNWNRIRFDSERRKLIYDRDRKGVASLSDNMGLSAVICITNASTPIIAEKTLFTTYKFQAETPEGLRPLGGDLVKVFFVALTYFNKTEDQLDSDDDRLLYLFKESNIVQSDVGPKDFYKQVKDIRRVAGTSEVLKEAYGKVWKDNIEQNY